MMTIYRNNAGVFVASSLAIDDGGEFKAVNAGWINDNGIFKNILKENDYEDPAAFYNTANATTLTLTQGNASELTNRLSWIVNSVRIPLLSNLPSAKFDVDWSYYEYIVIDTGEVVPVDLFSTNTSDQPTALGVKYENGTVSLLLNSTKLFKTITNMNVVIADNKTYIGSTSGYSYFKVQQQDYSSFYGKQLGLRWRWHSQINDKYFEYIFTNSNFALSKL